MSIIISYNRIGSDWYVGELYHMFAEYMLSIHKNNISIIKMEDLAIQYNELFNFRKNALPSIFNIYNLIVYNTDNNIGYLHSLADYAHTLLYHDEGLAKLNIKTISFCSNLTEQIIQQAKLNNINIVPSFYILENLSDYNYIITHRLKNKNKQQCYFNGAAYSYRKCFVDCLNNDSFFVIKDKSIDYLLKIDYYKTLSEYEYGLSLNGAAQICYRDLEYFGLGTLCIREPLDIVTKDQILPNVHYIPLIDNYILQNIYNNQEYINICNYLKEKILSISEAEKSYILHNSYEWFNNNVTIDKQINFLYSSIIQAGVI